MPLPALLRPAHAAQPCCSTSSRVAYVGQSSRVAGARQRRRAPVAHAASATATGFAVRLARLSDFGHVARLRAEAFYEDDRSRFVESLKKKFAGQEVEALQARTAQIKGKPEGVVLCECLVATEAEADGSDVLGCIDVRLPAVVTGMQPMGLPLGDEGGCYLLNVVVREDMRGQGVGKALMRAAMARAVTQWRAEALYTRVDAQNEVAYRLYTGCGFEEHRTEAQYEGTLSLGRLLLLRAPASAVQA